MWKEIKEMLPKWFTVERYAIGQHVLAYKYRFCKDHKVSWKNDCWLCQYFMRYNCNNCERCPLNYCGYMPNGDASPWQIVMQWRYSLELKLEACDKIIAALNGRHIKMRKEIQA